MADDVRNLAIEAAAGAISMTVGGARYKWLSAARAVLDAIGWTPPDTAAADRIATLEAAYSAATAEIEELVHDNGRLLAIASEAADGPRKAALEARIAELEAALRPFAEFPAATDTRLPPGMTMTLGSKFAAKQVVAADFWRAHVALSAPIVPAIIPQGQADPRARFGTGKPDGFDDHDNPDEMP
jgi:hypothetical protein